MKFKKLEIVNLASIAEATIDFERAPLGQEGLFLITGETGSGKTTILDAICLALFNDTPRMDHAPSQNKYYTRDCKGNDVEMSFNDVRQLLRRTAREAKVVLNFEANNGNDYTATWSVRLTRNNTLTKVEWTLTGNGLTTNKINDTRNEIANIVGMSMTQFTRTVMLPQGGFAEFLKSDKKEKSSLLEKITGTEIYAATGRNIYAITQEHKNAYTTAQAEMQGITLLSDEERSALANECNVINATITEQKRIAEQAKKWVTLIDNIGTNAKELEQVTQQVNTCRAQAETPEFKAEKATIDQWTTTDQARSWLNDQQSAESDLKKSNDRYEELKSTAARLNAALQRIEQQAESDKQKLDDYKAQLNGQQHLVTTFNNREAILSNIGSIDKQEEGIANTRDDLDNDTKRLPKTESDVNNTRIDRDKADKEAKRCRSEVDDMSRQIDALNLPDCRNRINDINNQIAACHQASSNLQLLDQHRQALAKHNEEIQQLRTELVQLRTTRPLLEQACNDARQHFDEAKRRYEVAKARTEDWAMQMRVMLHKGDECPVCGTIIRNVLSNDALQPLTNEAKTEADDAQVKLIKAQASLSTCDESVKRIEGEISKKSADSSTLQQNVEQQQAKLQQSCTAAGLKADICNDAAIVARISVLEGEKSTPSATLKRGEELEKRLKELREKSNALHTKHEQAQNAAAEAEKTFNLLNTTIATHKKLLDTQRKALNDIITNTSRLITAQRWQGVWHKERKEFASWLNEEAVAYQNLLDRSNTLEQQLQSTSACLEAMRNSRQRMLAMQPQWSDVMADEGPTQYNASQAQQRWNDLATLTQNWGDNNKSVKERVDNARQRIDDFLNSHDIARDRLVELAQISSDDIDKMRKAHDDYANKLANLEGRLQTVKQKVEQLNASNTLHLTADNRPEWQEKAETADKQMSEASQRIGSIKQQLLTDNNNRDKQLAIKERVDRLHDVYQKWDQLRELLGDSNGAKFREIAQSLILDNLVQCANDYLKRFTPRFTLSCNPGTLTILVSDNGSAPTATSTLSGGETFMVSLSLALALAQTGGQQLSVDTLFIDEGFGSLSNDYIDSVVGSLSRLHEMGGRRVGIISHVEQLKAHIPTKIEVTRDPNDNTRSIVSIVST